MSGRVEVRIARHLWQPLWHEVRRPGSPEPVVFGLVSHAKTADGTLVLVRDLVRPPETAFVQSAKHGAMWSGAYNIALLNEALARDLGIVIFHYHLGPGAVRMSDDDIQSARQLLPAFQMVAPDRPHGSIVLGDASATGMLLLPGRSAFVEKFRLRFFADSMTTFPVPTPNPGQVLLYRRQPLADSDVARSLLRRTTAAVVGLSGGGTQVATQLAGVGIGEIIGIDAQRVTPDNSLATDEFSRADVSSRRLKTAATSAMVKRISQKVKFTEVEALVPEKPALDALKRADVIVGCVNNLHARADLQEIAWRYCIPYIDTGLGLFPLDPDDELSEIASISGNIFAAIPGGPCLWCTGFLSDEKLERESGGNRSYLRTRLSAQNSKQRAIQVSQFNCTLAGLAVADVLQLVLGYSPNVVVRKQFDGFSGTVTEVVVQKKEDCPKCNSALGSGDLVWR